MVQAPKNNKPSREEDENELREFWDLDSGEDTTMIDGTEGSLLTLPTLTSNNK